MIEWDKDGERLWETGVDHGVLYLRDVSGDYSDGFAWNGLTTVTESPSGGENNKQYADNRIYAILKSTEEYNFTIEAFMYPDEFARCDGSAEPTPGMFLGQQRRETFGFSWRTLLGNDVVGDSYGEKLHFAYGCDAQPSEQTNNTVNDSPELKAFSWECASTPVAVGTLGGTEYRPTAHVFIDSTRVGATEYADLKTVLYTDERLPLPAEIYDILQGGSTEVDMGVYANQPSYNAGTHVITLPAVTGVQWLVDGVEVSSGAQPALTVGEEAHVVAQAESGYFLSGDNDWVYNY